MPILALETSSQVSSVAVASDGRLIAEITKDAQLTHSETLMLHVEAALKMAATPKEKLAAIAVSLGPGSFTGLRIGLATAKAMAYALRLPLIGVPSLEALAYNFPVAGIRIAALMDAQKGNAYRAVFAWEDGRLIVHSPAQVMSLPDIIDECGHAGQPVVLLGDIVRKKIAGRMDLPANTKIAPPHLIMPRAANAAMLGLAMLAAGQTANVMDLEPIYIRRSEAEVLWEKRRRGTAGSEAGDHGA